MKKSTLKEKNSYYWEAKPWYDKLPATLPKVSFKTEISPKAMTHREILDTYKIVPYISYIEAFAVCAAIIPTLKNDWRSRIVYFKEDDVLYRLSAFRSDDGQLDVRVREVRLDDGCGPVDGVCFGNSTLKPKTSSTLESSDSSLEKAKEMVKKAGYKIIKIQ